MRATKDALGALLNAVLIVCFVLIAMNQLDDLRSKAERLRVQAETAAQAKRLADAFERERARP